MEEQPDVVADSSPAQETPQPPEEALNTGDQPVEKTREAQHIPYERFQEVNNRLKELQESEDYIGFQRLKEALDRDAQFADFFQNSVASYFQKLRDGQAQNQSQDPFAQYPKEIADSLRKQAMLEQQVQQLVTQNQAAQQQANYQQYINRFNEKVDKLELSDPWKNFYQQQVALVMSAMNPNALQAYDQALLDKAFQLVDQELKGLQRAERSSYIADKTKDKTPASTSASGSPAQTTTRLRSAEDRASMVAELMKAANN